MLLAKETILSVVLLVVVVSMISVGKVAPDPTVVDTAATPVTAATATVATITRVSDDKAKVLELGNLVPELIRTGVLDEQKFRQLYARRGGVPREIDALLKGATSSIALNQRTAGYMLNLLWAVGLGHNHPVLTAGPMVDPKYGGAEGFASTAGWTLGKGGAMDHYAAHHYFNLTPEQERLVTKIADTIYRPCCGNSAAFPDCNHGMAMLALVELLVSQGKTEAEVKAWADYTNNLWFPPIQQNSCAA